MSNDEEDPQQILCPMVFDERDLIEWIESHWVEFWYLVNNNDTYWWQIMKLPGLLSYLLQHPMGHTQWLRWWHNRKSFKESDVPVLRWSCQLRGISCDTWSEDKIYLVLRHILKNDDMVWLQHMADVYITARGLNHIHLNIGIMSAKYFIRTTLDLACELNIDIRPLFTAIINAAQTNNMIGTVSRLTESLWSSMLIVSDAQHDVLLLFCDYWWRDIRVWQFWQQVPYAVLRSLWQELWSSQYARFLEWWWEYLREYQPQWQYHSFWSKSLDRHLANFTSHLSRENVMDPVLVMCQHRPVDVVKVLSVDRLRTMYHHYLFTILNLTHFDFIEALWPVLQADPEWFETRIREASDFQWPALHHRLCQWRSLLPPPTSTHTCMPCGCINVCLCNL
jgi:hypothetical protein